MPHNIVISKTAINDISEIIEYIEIFDSQNKANYVLNEIEKKISSLSILPSRGRQVDELIKVGIKVANIKQISFKPYRIVYKIDESDVIIEMVLDGRRDLDDLLVSRMINQ